MNDKTEVNMTIGIDKIGFATSQYGLLQPGALQFEIEKAESCRIQNPACTERLNRLL